jgi:hypothetical protein
MFSGTPEYYDSLIAVDAIQTEYRTAMECEVARQYILLNGRVYIGSVFSGPGIDDTYCVSQDGDTSDVGGDMDMEYMENNNADIIEGMQE